MILLTKSGACIVCNTGMQQQERTTPILKAHY
jgi:hypothetical protein